MRQIPQIVLVALCALGAGGTIFLVGRALVIGSRTARALAAFAKPTAARPSADINQRLGLVRPAYTPLAYAGAVLAPAGLALLMGMPLVPACGLGGLGYILADEVLKGRRRRVRLAIEAGLPTFISRLGGMLLVNAAPRSALEDVAATLDVGTPLAIWIGEFLARWKDGGSAYLSGAQAEAAEISPMLALLVYQIRRLDETGGSGFTRAFATTARELSTILEVRALAGAKAEGARTAVLTMLGIMGLVILLMLSSPAIRQGYATPGTQLVALACLAVMGFGYGFLNGMINDALEA